MQTAELSCTERLELEQMIHRCVKELATYAREAGKDDPERSREAFRETAQQYDRLRIRLETLREVLDVHRRIHRC